MFCFNMLDQKMFFFKNLKKMSELAKKKKQNKKIKKLFYSINRANSQIFPFFPKIVHEGPFQISYKLMTRLFLLPNFLYFRKSFYSQPQ